MVFCSSLSRSLVVDDIISRTSAPAATIAGRKTRLGDYGVSVPDAGHGDTGPVQGRFLAVSATWAPARVQKTGHAATVAG